MTMRTLMTIDPIFSWFTYFFDGAEGSIRLESGKCQHCTVYNNNKRWLMRKWLKKWHIAATLWSIGIVEYTIIQKKNNQWKNEVGRCLCWFSPLANSCEPPQKEHSSPREIGQSWVRIKRPSFPPVRAEASTQVGLKISEKEELLSTWLMRGVDGWEITFKVYCSRALTSFRTPRLPRAIERRVKQKMGDLDCSEGSHPPVRGLSTRWIDQSNGLGSCTITRSAIFIIASTCARNTKGSCHRGSHSYGQAQWAERFEVAQVSGSGIQFIIQSITVIGILDDYYYGDVFWWLLSEVNFGECAQKQKVREKLEVLVITTQADT